MVIDKDSEGNASIGGTSTLTFKEENDAMFSVSSGDGSTFSLKLHFDDGDSNFDGLVDILDLQTSINYAFNNCDKLFNFTAANLRADDDVINVQDVVKEVDLLMATSSNSREAISYSRAMDSNYDNYNFCQDETAIIGISDGCLWIDTQTPVAAFDLTLSTECGLQVNNALRQLGLTCTMQQQENGLRIIGYSLTGFTLPIGRTVIGTIADENAVLMRALLSDPEAVPIGVAADNGQTTGIIDAPLDLWSLATKGTQERSTFNVQRYYDLQGRRVSKSAKKGVYIMHDMKILKK